MSRSDARPGRVPHPDPRDQGNLPEKLVQASIALAKLLRYEVHRSGAVGPEGWLDAERAVEQLRRGGQVVNQEDIQTIVRESFTKDKARFESKREAGQLYVRAGNAEHYRDRALVQSRGGPRGGADVRQRGTREFRGRQTQARGSEASSGHQIVHHREMGRARQTTSRLERKPKPAESTVFDGTWEEKGASFPTCRIQADTIWWIRQGEDEIQEPVAVTGNKIVVGAQKVVGYLSEDERSIKFDDGDEWERCAEVNMSIEQEFDADWSKADWSSVSRPDGDLSMKSIADGPVEDTAGPDALPDAGASSSGMLALEDGAAAAAAAQPSDITQPAVYSWHDQRAKETWDASPWGVGYLSLVKGELLQVQIGLDGGWAFGRSLQHEKEGWFPPSYAEKV